jgi:hypothetical protein
MGDEVWGRFGGGIHRSIGFAVGSLITRNADMGGNFAQGGGVARLKGAFH